MTARKNSPVGTLLVAALGFFAWLALPRPLAVSQTSGSAETKPQTRSLFRKVTIDNEVNQLAKSLQLNQTQQAGVTKILEFRRIQARRIRDDGSITGAERIGRLRRLQDETIEQIRSVLNEDQKKKYDPLAVRQTQKPSSQPSVEDWMKAAAPSK